MKKLLPLLFIILLSCSSDDKEKTHKDLSGTWKFSQGDISGTLKITNVNSEYLLVHSGNFTINGTKYTNAFDWEIDVVGDGTIDGFNLISADEKNYVQFSDGVYNEDYTQIVYTLYAFKEECCVQETIEEMIVLTRK